MSSTHTCDAWVLYPGKGDMQSPEPAELVREPFTFADIGEEEALVEPLYGSWQGNMSHALARRPIDICRARKEAKVIIGNAGVVRVLKVGAAIKHLREGDLCTIGSSDNDEFGYMLRAPGYDQPGSMGVLATRVKYHGMSLHPIPRDTRFTPRQWAAFSLRYPTAWSNWKVAFGAYRLQLTEEDEPAPHVWGWSGGTTLAELDLARRFGCRTTMIVGNEQRRREIESYGVRTVDRGLFRGLDFDEKRSATDPAYRAEYLKAQEAFLRIVAERTGGAGVDIFVEYIGSPVFRATQRALRRLGVLTTAGWMLGTITSSNRAIECISRHTYVHTHFARHGELVPAMQYAEQTGWIPKECSSIYSFDDIPRLARDAAAGTTDSLFPLFQVNPL
jgi:NADPH:quinone reductase-like Zn-dependent oxidoreductase